MQLIWRDGTYFLTIPQVYSYLRIPSSGMWCHVVLLRFADILVECTAPTFKVDEWVEQVNSMQLHCVLKIYTVCIPQAAPFFCLIHTEEGDCTVCWNNFNTRCSYTPEVKIIHVAFYGSLNLRENNTLMVFVNMVLQRLLWISYIFLIMYNVLKPRSIGYIFFSSFKIKN